MNRNHIKSDGIDGSVVHGIRLAIHFSFVLDKQEVHEIFCKPESIH